MDGDRRALYFERPVHTSHFSTARKRNSPLAAISDRSQCRPRDWLSRCCRRLARRISLEPRYSVRPGGCIHCRHIGERCDSTNVACNISPSRVCAWAVSQARIGWYCRRSEHGTRYSWFHRSYRSCFARLAVDHSDNSSVRRFYLSKRYDLSMDDMVGQRLCRYPDSDAFNYGHCPELASPERYRADRISAHHGMVGAFARGIVHCLAKQNPLAE